MDKVDIINGIVVFGGVTLVLWMTILMTASVDGVRKSGLTALKEAIIGEIAVIVAGVLLLLTFWPIKLFIEFLKS